jgi:asparagine synthase (glutamine-hydrolysing)
MCGIAGATNLVDHHVLQTMIASLTHRGPDDAGVWLAPPAAAGNRIGLGNCRLAIIDLSGAGHQPMLGAEGHSVITYNGEVYNHPELRADLKQRGERFTSHTDTEVVLRLLDRVGADCLPRLNGMFGLAYWNARAGELLLARDRYGTKPVYYAQVAGGGLVFASEIKAMLAHPDIHCEVDLEALDAYLRFLWVPGPKTLFRGIFKLPPGCFLRWREGHVDVRSYWDIQYHDPAAANEAELAAELREVLERAVRRHLISDVPVGLFLSGGLDSSALLALVDRVTGRPARTFTIAYRAEDASLEQAGQADARHARRLARQFGADHHEIVVQPTVADLLPEVVYHLDEPVADPAAISTLLISRAASGPVKVLLSGQGADEVFAGYRVHYAAHLAGLVGPLVTGAAGRWVSAGIGLIPGLPMNLVGVPVGKRLAAHRYLRQLVEVATLPPVERYVALRSYYAADQQRTLYASDMFAISQRFDAAQWHRSYFQAAPDGHGLNRLLYTDLKTFLPELNLTYSDKLTAAASIEGRVPYLDNEVVEFAARLPTSMKLHGWTGKYLLRRALRGLLPEEVVSRGKAGFGAPVRKWLRDELRPLVRDLLDEDVLRRRGYFDTRAVHDLVRRNETGVEDQPLRVWALLTLEVWHRTFIDSDSTRLKALRHSAAAGVN